MGVATSSVTFFRQVGGSLGTAIFLSILFTRAATEIPKAIASSDVDPAALAKVNLNDTSALNSLSAHDKHPVLVGFSNAMDTVFLVGGLVLILAFVLAIFLREVPLRMVSGQRALAEEAAADAAPGGPVAVPDPIEADTVAGPDGPRTVTERGT